MKIIKIYSSWNQLKLKARASHYNIEAHVRFEGRGVLGRARDREDKTFIGEKCVKSPWPWERCEVSRAPGSGGTMVGLSMFTPGMCFKHQQQSQLQRQHHYRDTAAPGTQVSPGTSGQARLCVVFVQRQMSGGETCHDITRVSESDVASVGSDVWGVTGGGAPGVTETLSGIILVRITMTRDKYLDTKVEIITHSDVLLRWIQFAAPLHCRNMPLISDPADWFRPGHNIDTGTISKSLLIPRIIGAFADTNGQFRCHDSKLWDDYCYYN